MRLTVFILEQECEVFVSPVSPLTNGTAACVPCGNTFISCGASPDITVLPYWVKGPAYTIGHIHRIYASISLIFRSNAFPLYIPKVFTTNSATFFSWSVNASDVSENIANRASSIGLYLKSLKRS